MPDMNREELRALTEGERTYLMDIGRRAQPTCPGCGQPMHLDVERAFDGSREWWGRYACHKTTGGCGVWGTQVSRHPSIVALAERAYKEAMTREEGAA